MAPASSLPAEPGQAKAVLFFIEGFHDINFLLIIGELLHVHHPGLPDLADLLAPGKVIFVPTGGDLIRWACRLAPLKLPELHPYGREMPPLTRER